MSPKLIIILIGFLALGGALGAQSNQALDILLEQDQAHLDSAAYVILASVGKVPETADSSQVMAALADLGLAWMSSEPGRTVTVEELSFLLMKSLDIPGGIMYAIFPGPRYAYRVLAPKKVVIDAGGPYRKVSGEEVIRSLRYALELKGGTL